MKGENPLDEINNALNAIYCSTINKIDVDLANKEITFYLSLTDSGNVTKHELKFINCTSFLWVEKNGIYNSYDFKNCNYYELTSINIKKITTTSIDKWLKQYSMEYNVAVEIWETALLINATDLIIDYNQFSI